ncbi:MAG: hypothetical protein ACRDYU_01495 [Actinomycetes bacterium]
MTVNVAVEPGWVDYLTAVGTVGAVVVALALGFIGEVRSVRLARAAAKERERAQAVRVAAWKEVESVSAAGATGWVGHTVLQNGSDEPIWDVTVHVTTGGPWNIVQEAGIVAPSARLVWTHEDASPAEGQYVGLSVEFTDNARRRWERTATGELKRTAAPRAEGA